MIDEMKNISRFHRTGAKRRRSLSRFGQRRLNRFKYFADRLFFGFFSMFLTLTDVYLPFSFNVEIFFFLENIEEDVCNVFFKI